MKIRNYFKQFNENLSQEWRFPLMQEKCESPIMGFLVHHWLSIQASFLKHLNPRLNQRIFATRFQAALCFCLAHVRLGFWDESTFFSATPPCHITENRNNKNQNKYSTLALMKNKTHGKNVTYSFTELKQMPSKVLLLYQNS